MPLLGIDEGHEVVRWLFSAARRKMAATIIPTDMRAVRGDPLLTAQMA